MNTSEFMNAVGKQAESVIHNDKMCLDYVIIKANDCVRDGVWTFYTGENGIKRLVEILIIAWSNIAGKKGVEL